jgi:hypothetical protein
VEIIHRIHPILFYEKHLLNFNGPKEISKSPGEKTMVSCGGFIGG